MEVRLVLVSPPASKREIAINLPTTIGRSREAKLKLVHTQVSRLHCEMFERNGMLFVRDLGSTNGTFVGDERITEAPVPPGQTLTIGSVTFQAVYKPGDDWQLPPAAVAGTDTIRTGVGEETFRAPAGRGDAAPTAAGLTLHEEKTLTWRPGDETISAEAIQPSPAAHEPTTDDFGWLEGEPRHPPPRVNSGQAPVEELPPSAVEQAAAWPTGPANQPAEMELEPLELAPLDEAGDEHALLPPEFSSEEVQVPPPGTPARSQAADEEVAALELPEGVEPLELEPLEADLLEPDMAADMSESSTAESEQEDSVAAEFLHKEFHLDDSVADFPVLEPDLPPEADAAPATASPQAESEDDQAWSFLNEPAATDRSNNVPPGDESETGEAKDKGNDDELDEFLKGLK